MIYSQWNIPRETPCIPDEFAAAGFSPLLAAILCVRGFDTPEKARRFLDVDESLLGDPGLLVDMTSAVMRLQRAIDSHEIVAVYGDYDVDGITSACMLTDYLRARGLRCELYIPDRLEEGYGVNADAIKKLHTKGVTLIVTVDCGVTAVEETRLAEELGIQMIITDHHECPDILPDAQAVVDPKRADCSYPSHDLAGVGVAFKLLCALEGSARPVLDHYADLVAIGTVADVMPLEGENRYIVARGLEKLNTAPRIGLRALLEETGLWGKDTRGDKKPVTATNIGFTLAPRLNASGRLGQVRLAVDLLLADSPAKARAFAAELCELNRSRQQKEADIWEQAQKMLTEDAPDVPIVLYHEAWHQGVIGIAASRLAEKYNVPAIMISLDGDKGKGSCRSSGGFNLFEALSACSEYLDGFGGHALAAGLTISRENIGAFRAAFAAYYRAHAAECVSTLDIDLCVESPSLLTLKSVEDLAQIEPCGTGNPRPRLCLLGADLTELTPIGGGRHLRLVLNKFDVSFEAVFFNQSAESIDLRVGDCVDAAFFPQVNEFRDRRSVQLLLSDLRYNPSAAENILHGNYPPEPTELPRADFARLWRDLKSRGGSFTAPLNHFNRDLCPVLREKPFYLCLKVLEDLGLLRLRLEGDTLTAEQLVPRTKADLESSALWQRLTGAPRSGSTDSNC